jgi:RNA polymerase sigma-70 factor (ECF subfamily)
MDDPDQQDLTAVLADGNLKAFGRLVEKYQLPVRGFLLRLVKGDHALADDLAQETFLTAFRRIETFAGSGKFSSWLFQIAYRSFLQNLRKAGKAIEVELNETELPDPVPSDPSVAIDLERALAGLRSEERTAITICYTYGLTHSEASAILGWPLGSVKSHIDRGKTKLRALMAPDPVEAKSR